MAVHVLDGCCGLFSNSLGSHLEQTGLQRVL
jgi:hypothetical protein